MRKLVAGLVMVAGTTLLTGGVVSAQDAGCPESPQECPPTTLPEVGGTTVVPPVTVTPRQPEVAGTVVSPQVEAGLPVTGTETVLLVGAGVALAAGGGVLVLRSKRTADAG